jgi:hypothetical protein
VDVRESLLTSRLSEHPREPHRQEQDQEGEQEDD